MKKYCNDKKEQTATQSKTSKHTRRGETVNKEDSKTG